MKKILTAGTLLIFGLVLGSCGSSNSKSEPASIQDQIIDACENNNFANAYKLAGTDQSLINDIIKKECAYILESQREEGLLKISYIINERNANWLYLDMLKLAIQLGDESLAQKLFSMGNSCDKQALDYAITAGMGDLVLAFIDADIKFLDNKRILSFLKENYYSKFCDLIKKAVYQVGVTQNFVRIAVEDNNMELVESMWILDNSILEMPEVESLYKAKNPKVYKEKLAKMKNKQIQDELGSLNEKLKDVIIGTPVSDKIIKSQSNSLDQKYEDYISSVKRYNSICLEYVQRAIKLGNLKLANSVLQKFKKNVYSSDLGVYATSTVKEKVRKSTDTGGIAGFLAKAIAGDSYEVTEDKIVEKNKFQITTDWADKDAAKKIISEAQATGKLK